VRPRARLAAAAFVATAAAATWASRDEHQPPDEHAADEPPEAQHGNEVPVTDGEPQAIWIPYRPVSLLPEPPRRRSRRLPASVALAAALVGAAVAIVAMAGDDPRAAVTDRPADQPLPLAPPPAFTVRRAIPVRPLAGMWRAAPLRAPVFARVRPARRAPRVARVAALTPEGTTNIVLVLGRLVEGRDGRLWARIHLPLIESARTGWVPRTALRGYITGRTRLVVDTRALRATLFRAGRAVWSAPVGIGAPGSPTPRGRFYIRNRLIRYRSPFYGPVAFGTSARAAVSDWPARGFVGIHGTSLPTLIPGRVSHGCIRMRNRDIRALDRLMPVGTPLRIV
jgi:hypothetical protein